MKVIVFGATGSVGTLAVMRLLKDGHRVTAFARRVDKLTIRHPALTLRSGDATDREAVFEAVKGQDAVVITLGAGLSRTSVVRSQGTLTIIQAMQAHGVRRLICQSTLGAHESWANLNFFWKRIMFGLLLRPVLLDHELQESLVRASGLDWTIVRPSAFTDGPSGEDFKEGFGPEVRGLKLKIAKADIASFLSRQLSDGRYLGKAVAISC